MSIFPNSLQREFSQFIDSNSYNEFAHELNVCATWAAQISFHISGFAFPQLSVPGHQSL